MSEQDGMQDTSSRRARLRERIGTRPWVRSAALVGSGLVAGGILAGAVTASAADGGDGSSRASSEEALSGETAGSVEETVLEEYPDAEIQRLETDADGVYEAHIVTADGEELTVELDEEFTVTGTE